MGTFFGLLVLVNFDDWALDEESTIVLQDLKEFTVVA